MITIAETFFRLGLAMAQMLNGKVGGEESCEAKQHKDGDNGCAVAVHVGIHPVHEPIEIPNQIIPRSC